MLRNRSPWLRNGVEARIVGFLGGGEGAEGGNVAGLPSPVDSLYPHMETY